MKTILSYYSVVMLLLVLAVSLQAQTQSAPSQSQTTPAEVWSVTIGVFSGRPDPVFTLLPSEVAEVRARLGKAPSVRAVADAKETILPARLGYRGMRLKASTGDKVIEDMEICETQIQRKTAGALSMASWSASKAIFCRWLLPRV